MPPRDPPPRPSRSSARSHRDSIKKTKVIINVYDLLPPGRLSTFAWTIGIGLLHSGIVINDREYAFGGHDRRGLTGVYWTKPKTEPPGGTFRSEVLHGFTYASDEEIEDIVREASNAFLGPTYNLLTRNCNHFTSHLCLALTGQAAPPWLNRAASIGVSLPCIVPAGWIEPPECDTEQERLTANAGAMASNRDDAWGSSEGEYTDEEEERERERERERRIRRERERGVAKKEQGVREAGVRDEGGSVLPGAEQARLDRTVEQ